MNSTYRHIFKKYVFKFSITHVQFVNLYNDKYTKVFEIDTIAYNSDTLKYCKITTVVQYLNNYSIALKNITRLNYLLTSLYQELLRDDIK